MTKKLAGSLTLLTLSALPVTAFACINTIVRTYTAAAVDHMMLAPLVAGLLIVWARRRGWATLPRECSIVASTFVGTLGVGLIVAPVFYTDPLWLLWTGVVSSLLLLAVFMRNRRRSEHALGMAILIAGILAMAFGFTSYETKHQLGFYAPTPPGAVDF